MDKYEYNIKSEQVRTYAEAGQFVDAVRIADTIDWRREKNITMLSVVTNAYRNTHRYEDAREIAEIAYGRNPASKSTLRGLCEICIKLDDIKSAVEYYREFLKVAPADPARLVLKYRIYSAQNRSLEECIAVLEKLKTEDYTERWSYELACLYRDAGDIERCQAECEEMILWFGEGKYVIRALEMLHELGEFTPEQRALYERLTRPAPPVTAKPAPALDENNYGNIGESVDISVDEVHVGAYDTIDMQRELAQNLQALMETDAQGEPPAPSESYDATEQGYLSQGSHGALDVSYESDALDEDQYDEQYDVRPEYDDFPEYDDHSFDDITGEIEQNFILQDTGVLPKTSLYTLPPDPNLMPDYDGQLEFINIEGVANEPQITGQIDIYDLMSGDTEEREAYVTKRPTESVNAVKEDQNVVPTESVNATVDEELNSASIQGDRGAVPTESVNTVSDEVPNATSSDSYDAVPTESVNASCEDTANHTTDESGTAVPTESVNQARNERTAVPTESVNETRSTVTRSTATRSPATGSPSDIKPVRPMSSEERSTFGAFAQTRETRRQIVAALDGMSLDPASGNVIITSEEGMDTLALAQTLIRASENLKAGFSGKAAKITAQSLVGHSLAQTFKKLAGGALIIERAGDMTLQMAESLCNDIEHDEDGLVVILQGTKRRMDSLLYECPKLAQCFDLRIDVETLGDSALAKYGNRYAISREHAVDDLGMLALHTCIQGRQTSDHAVSVGEVRSIVDSAIEHADRFTLGHFWAVIARKRYNSDDMVLLKEQDFRSVKEGA